MPSGWWHQVQNLEDTISINHNWANGCNIDLLVSFFVSGLVCTTSIRITLILQKRVEEALSDSREYFDDQGWEEQCALVSRADMGMDFPMLYAFIRQICLEQLTVLSGLSSDILAIPSILFSEEPSLCELVLATLQDLLVWLKGNTIPQGSPTTYEEYFLTIFNLYSLHSVIVKLNCQSKLS